MNSENEDSDRPTAGEPNGKGPAGALGPVIRTAEDAADLAARLGELDALDARVAELETRLAAARAELRAFKARYLAAVGARYAELDRIEAELAETLADRCPDDPELREKARQARWRADESAGALREDAADVESADALGPSNFLKRLYRRVAFELHPDRCANERDAGYRHELMVEANRAYSEGDGAMLESLLGEFTLPVGVAGGSELERVLRQLARATRRADAAEAALAELEASDLFLLRRAVEAGDAEGRDLLREVAGRLDRALSRARARLETIIAAV